MKTLSLERICQTLVYYIVRCELRECNFVYIGEEIILESKVFFYGLQIKAFNEGQTMFKVKYGDFKSMSAVFGNLNINNDLTGYP